MATAVLDQCATVRMVRRLHAEGLLSEEAQAAALRILRPASAWYGWVRRMLLLLGSTLVLAGIIFFFAYNWSGLDRFTTLGLIQAAVVVCAMGASWLGLARLTGKVLLLSAAVLVGVLLAVYGQTYQTGADAYELFVGWAVLILGWVMVSEFTGLWFLWLVLLNTGGVFYWKQVAEPGHSMPFEGLCLALFALNTAALALREWGVRSGREWLREAWFRGVVLTAALTAISIPVFMLIFSIEHSNALTLLGAGTWAVALAAGFYCYRVQLPDMVALSILVLNGCGVVLSLIGRLLFHNTHWGNAGVFLLFAFIIIGVVAAAAAWLRRIASSLAGEPSEGE